MTIGHINLNSLRNKFKMLKDSIKSNTDILLVSETKLHEPFPVGQFQIEWFSTPYRSDTDKNGGSILLYFTEDIPSKLVLFKDDAKIEHFLIGINLRKKENVSFIILLRPAFGFNWNTFELFKECFWSLFGKVW